MHTPQIRKCNNSKRVRDPRLMQKENLAGTNNAESVTSVSRISEEFFPIRSLIGMVAYDNEVYLGWKRA